MQGVAELGSRQLRLVDVVAIRLVDDDAICHLHDASFDALQLIACTRQLDQQEEIDHGMHSGLTLSHTDGLHKDRVESRGFAKHDGLTRLTGHTT